MVTAKCLLMAIFALAGVLCLIVAATGAEWFFNSPQSLPGMLPRKAARVVTALLGVAVLLMASNIFHDTFPSLF